MRLFILFFLSSLLMFSCTKETQPIDPFASQDPPTDDRTDDLNPTPTPTPAPQPTPPQTATITLSAQDLAEDDITLAYKRRRANPFQLGQYVDDEECHPLALQRCMLDGQVLFQFFTEEVNDQYPPEIWDVTGISMSFDAYVHREYESEPSTREDDDEIRSEVLCLSNYRVCSGYTTKRLRNRPFWRNRKLSDILRSSDFGDLVVSGQRYGSMVASENLKIDLRKSLMLRRTLMQTLVRKNEAIMFNTGKDIYMQNPNLTIELERRVP